MKRSIAGTVIGLFALLLLGWAVATTAQEWPKQRPIAFVVGFGPGSVSDILARVVAQKLAESIGQSVVAENRPGAGGNIAAQFVKRAAPDGYAILVTSVSYAINPSIYTSAGYDPLKDFVAIVLGGSTPNVITVHPSVPAKTLAELVELARKQPLSYAHSGIGTTVHLTMERLRVVTSIDMTHVPFQPAQAVGAVVAGQTQIAGTAIAPVAPQIKAGRLRAIAVTSAHRSPALPDVPTMAEQGFKDFDDVTWFGFFAPAGTPPELVGRLNAEINRILELPDVREKLGKLGLESRRNTPTEFAAFVKAEVPKWARAVKDSGAKVD